MTTDSMLDDGHNDLVFYASDVDGDRHMFANVPDDQVAQWVVVLVSPDGNREVAEAQGGFIGYRPDISSARPCWYADRDAGAWFEITLPDGATALKWANRWSHGKPPPSQADAFALGYKRGYLDKSRDRPAAY